MPVTQDYKLLSIWRDLLAARIVFFEPLGTHTSLVRELKAEMKITNEMLGSTHKAVASGDYVKLVLTGSERVQVETALAGRVGEIENCMKTIPDGAFAMRSCLIHDLAETQSAYAKVRA